MLKKKKSPKKKVNKKKSSSLSDHYVSIVEVGPRDGLQNETQSLSIDQRFEFVKSLSEAGVQRIEVGAFVSAKWVPQMQNSGELCKKIQSAQEQEHLNSNLRWSTLSPNLKGAEEAIACGVKEIAIFASASESFSQKNINCSISESLERYAQVIKLAKKHKVRVRAYLSMCFGCPFEGFVDPKVAVQLAEKFIKMGAYEISIGDTIGVAHPNQVRALVKALKKKIPLKKLAMHFHDTRGTALANILASLDLGIRCFDSSLGGLGGCPYAPSATGNVATEDVIYMLHGMGYQTDINLEALIQINKMVTQFVGHSLPSRLGKSGIPRVRSL